MTYIREDETPRGQLKKFSEWDGSWKSYKKYLSDNGALSSNFDSTLSLRNGYNPNWTVKDFK